MAHPITVLTDLRQAALERSAGEKKKGWREKKTRQSTLLPSSTDHVFYQQALTRQWLTRIFSKNDAAEFHHRDRIKSSNIHGVPKVHHIYTTNKKIFPNFLFSNNNITTNIFDQSHFDLDQWIDRKKESEGTEKFQFFFQFPFLFSNNNITNILRSIALWSRSVDRCDWIDRKKARRDDLRITEKQRIKIHSMNGRFVSGMLLPRRNGMPRY